VLGVIGAGVAAVALAALGARTFDWDEATAFVVLFAMSTLAQLWPVHLSVKTKMTVDDLPTFAAAILLGPFASMVIAGGSVLVALRYQRSRMPWYNRAFNVAVTALSTGAAAVTFAVLSRGAAPSFEAPLPIAVAAIARYLIQQSLVDIAVGLQLRHHPFARWWELHRRDLLNQATLYALGGLAAVTAGQQPLALALFAIPMAITLLTMRDSARVRADVRTAILELADLIDLRDPYTHGHSQRVSELAERLARHLSLQPTQVALIRDAARVHDIGKIGTNDMVLLKQGPLTNDEVVEMRKHAEMGHRLLRRLPEFWEGAELVLAHHERHDGKGYPRGLRGDELPLEVSVISVADTYDAMTTDRPYRRALPWVTVRSELLAGRDTQWRGEVVDAFIELMGQERARSAIADPRLARPLESQTA
jgi:putative nucleotidyltransferase with HDIG domain